MNDRPKLVKSTLREKHQAALGRLTAEFGAFELMLRDRLIRTAGLDHRIGYTFWGRAK